LVYVGGVEWAPRRRATLGFLALEPCAPEPDLLATPVG
jgi:hypothetical protein